MRYTALEWQSFILPENIDINLIDRGHYAEETGMMHKTKMQRDAEDALWLQMQAEEKAKADRIAKEKKYLGMGPQSRGLGEGRDGMAEGRRGAFRAAL
ncbi:hypothetical protein QWZ10_25545 [Paracoccus cavernae]|uniref:Uncharacterized protein n=1 Tax=Paracoccus cavernae TaxID=1571207 RepID=A0ABT8DC07_9RHOB|nr:hypothetical protein [Paracoccus cavernae]